MKNSKPVILVFTGGYLPGYKGGGPIRSIAALVEILGDEFDFKIVTLDRDLGMREAYSGISIKKWHRIGKAEVFYLTKRKLTFNCLRYLINSIPHDILYLNSFFSPRFSFIPMFLKKLGLIDKKITIVAPRGEFSQGALRLKAFKKRLYVFLTKGFGMYKDVIWQASSTYERDDIHSIFESARIIVASNLVAVPPTIMELYKATREPFAKTKTPGNLRLVFLSRISPKKNLDGALSMLKGVQGEVTFNIYGPIEDMNYWKRCQTLIELLSPNIRVNYMGGVCHDQVSSVLAVHDLFFFPTHGENFGHVIFEALIAGCPVLISDQSPWRDLEEKGVGWDLPLDRPELFTARLQKCVDMCSEELKALSRGAVSHGRERATDQENIHQNRELFNILS